MGEALNVKLFQHQQDGYNFAMVNKYPGTLFWHEMGLGKTLTTLIVLRALLAQLRQGGVSAPKILVLLPKSMLHQWKTETQKFTPDIYDNLLLNCLNLIAVSTFFVYNGKSALSNHPK